MNKVTKCETCGDWITRKVADYSFTFFGQYLCFECQQLEKMKRDRENDSLEGGEY